MRFSMNIADMLGASEEATYDKVTLYVPTRDRNGSPVEFESWVGRAMRLLSGIGGGATRLPPAQGAWLREDGHLIEEAVHMVYSYIDGDAFVAAGSKVRSFIHDMGRSLDQGEVVVELNDRFYKVRVYN
jgi:hypothetical protein